jgi:hypothetical protein
VEKAVDAEIWGGFPLFRRVREWLVSGKWAKNRESLRFSRDEEQRFPVVDLGADFVPHTLLE